jgi:hypothetical protein
MNTPELLIAYLAVGTAGAVFSLRAREVRTRAAYASAALMVPLWPLWAPFVFNAEHETGNASQGSLGTKRFEQALREAVRLAAGTPLESFFSRHVAARVEGAVSRAIERAGALAALAKREGADRESALRRVEELEARGAAPRVVATARLQLETAQRLATVVARDQQALTELAELLDALCMHLALARHAGSGTEGVDGLVTEVWARLEVLGTTLETRDPVEAS